MFPILRSRTTFLTFPRDTVLVATLIAMAPLGALASTITWNNPSGGSWSNAANWSPSVVPDGAGQSVVLPALSGPYQVTLDRNPTLDALAIAAGGPALDLGAHSIAAVTQVTNAGTIRNFRGTYDSNQIDNQSTGLVEVADADSIIVSGTIDNDGTITVGPSWGSAVRVVSTDVAFQGSGTLRLLSDARITTPVGYPQGPVGYRLQNGANHTLAGSGHLWLKLLNLGLVHSDGGSLRIKGITQNYGTLRVDNSGHIEQNGLVENFNGTIVGSGGSYTCTGTIDDLDGGTLIADGGDLSISTGTIVEGTVLRTGGSGAVRIQIATLQNVIVAENSELIVDGQIDLMANGTALTNNGIVRVPGRVSGGGTVSLAGTGTMILEGGVLDTPTGGSIEGDLTNQATHTITGCGTISARLTNYGVIDADCGTMAIQANPITNRGLIRASHGVLHVTGATTQLLNRNGGHMVMDGGEIWIERGATLDITGGTLNANHGTVLLGTSRTACTLVGGTLESSQSGQFLNYGTATLRDVTIGASGSFVTWDRATTQATGTRFTNLGSNRLPTGGRFTVGATTDFVQNGGETVLEGGTLTSTRELQFNGGGREVANLGAGLRPAGRHTFALSGTTLPPSGVYFARAVVHAHGRTDARTARVAYLK